VDAVGPAFESIRALSGFDERITPQGNSVFNCHHRDLEQTHLCLVTEGMAVTNPQRYAFSLFNTILGGNMSSRLFQQIRERRGLAYSVYSFVTSHVDTGLFGVYTGVAPAQAGQAVELIMDEFRRLQSEPVRPDELRDAKEYTKGNLLLASESIDNQMVRLAQNEIHFGRPVPLQEVFDQIEAVTGEDILSLAHQLLGSRKMSLTILGTVAEKAAIGQMLQL
jgi:predicted Zn-dependent peptidase